MGPTSSEYGRRLVANVIDQLGRNEPHRGAFQVPRTEDPEDGWKTITFKEYANAIDLCAYEIVKHCGMAPKGAFPTLAYIGPQDARYVVFLVAAIKAGYQALFLSTRNSKEGQISLLADTACHVVFCAESYRYVVEQWQVEGNLKVVDTKPCHTWFSDGEVPRFPYEKTFEEAEWDPLCVLHTSGSTGHPKPITVRQGMIAISDACHNLGGWQDCIHWVPAWMGMSKRHFLPMPLFHAAALYVFIISVVWWKTPVVLGFGERPLTASLVLDCFRQLDVESAALPPSIIEEMSQEKAGLDALRKLKLVPIAGGSLARDVGDHLVDNGVVLCNLINSTEFTPFPLYFQPRPELWQYFIINPELFGCDWRKHDVNVYELVVVRQGKHPGMQGFFYTFPDLDEFNTNDLFEPHPTLPNHWKYHGRADNIIVLSNSEKLNPVTIENIVQGHPNVKGALVVGSGRFQPGLLVEPSVHPQNEDERRALIEELWPYVAMANSDTVAHGQIARDLLMLSQPQKPFCRAGKGTVQRSATLKSYENEIEQMYEAAELDLAGLDLDGVSPELSLETLEASITSLLAQYVRTEAGMDQDTDFFQAGMDSLQVMNAARRLRVILQALGYPVPTISLVARVIYNNPTARKLSQFILYQLAQGGEGSSQQSQEEERREVEVMQALHERYTSNFIQETSTTRPEGSRTSQVVLLTGSTGALGSYVLDRLLQSRSVTRVVCLNRAQDGGHRQQTEAMKDRGLSHLHDDKVEFHHIDVSQGRLGLPADVYLRLLGEADGFIHCAWPVNFNLPTEAFDHHLHGVRMIADFAATAAKRVKVVFTSSVSTADRWQPSQGLVPEQRIEDWALPGNGYGRSKMVGSLILEDAARACNFPGASIRIGQIAGPESGGGSWNKNEWLPRIIASSLYLSALPSELGRANTIDWTPIERVASLVTEIAGVDNDAMATEQMSGYFHCVNTSTTTWQELASAVQEFYGNLKLVSFKDWICMLEQSQGDGTDVAVNPGLQLIETYRSMAYGADAGPFVFDMALTNAKTHAMRGTTAITPELMTHWCRQWAF